VAIRHRPSPDFRVIAGCTLLIMILTGLIAARQYVLMKPMVGPYEDDWQKIRDRWTEKEAEEARLRASESEKRQKWREALDPIEKACLVSLESAGEIFDAASFSDRKKTNDGSSDYFAVQISASKLGQAPLVELCSGSINGAKVVVRSMLPAEDRK
jgi:hypothetical protein